MSRNDKRNKLKNNKQERRRTFVKSKSWRLNAELCELLKEKEQQDTILHQCWFLENEISVIMILQKLLLLTMTQWMVGI